LVVLASVVLFVDSAKAGEYTYLQRARGQIFNAVQTLQNMKPARWGERRENAMRAMKVAMAEVDAALKTAGVTTYREASIIQAKGGEQRLAAVLKITREAREALHEGKGGFSGHCVSAIKELDVAIRELEAAQREDPGPVTGGKGSKKRASQ
jgi:hypothetical protein